MLAKLENQDLGVKKCKGWRSIENLTDDERAVFKGLENPEWQWRTIGKLAQECSLTEEQVIEILKKYSDLIECSKYKGSEGESLFTLREKRFNEMSLRQKVAMFLGEG